MLGIFCLHVLDCYVLLTTVVSTHEAPTVHPIKTVHCIRGCSTYILKKRFRVKREKRGVGKRRRKRVFLFSHNVPKKLTGDNKRQTNGWIDVYSLFRRPARTEMVPGSIHVHPCVRANETPFLLRKSAMVLVFRSKYQSIFCFTVGRYDT